jgi:hypothetical protein
MARTQEQWNAVMSSPLMTREIYEVFFTLWSSPTSLTKAEVDAACKHYNFVKNQGAPWEKQLPLMRQMGIVKQDNKRHCSVKNKPETTWTITDATTLKKPKVAKPSAKKFALAVAQLDQLIAYHERAQDGAITADLKKLADWVRDKVQPAKQ